MNAIKPQLKNWQRMKFKDFANISPSVKLKKGKFYSFIPMEVLDGKTRFPLEIKKKKFSCGGAKFINGDTIFARITPCLENGKIAQVKNLEDNIGFGSTEFFVFRNKNGISNSNFLYYLSKTGIICDPAEKSMFGASGRQRADKKVIENIEILVPTLKEQKKIADILSVYDNLIEVNNKKIKNLEEMAQAIYNEWFVKFKFPNYEKTKFENRIPEGWEKKRIQNIIKNVKIKYINSEHKNLPLLDLKRIPRKSLMINDYGLSSEIKTARKIFDKYDILFGNIRTYFHKVIFAVKPGITNSSVFVFRGKKSIYQNFFFNYFFSEDIVSWAIQNSGGTKMPVIGWNVFKVKKILLPTEDIIKEFNYIIQPMADNIINLNLQNEKLRETRDSLLPKLISGEIKI